MTNMSGQDDEFLELLPEGVKLLNTRMERKIKIFSDLSIQGIRNAMDSLQNSNRGTQESSCALIY